MGEKITEKYCPIKRAGEMTMVVQSSLLVEIVLSQFYLLSLL